MKFWAILAVFLLGCTEDRTYHGSTAFPEGERAEIELGNAYVAEKMGRDPFVIVWDSNGTEDRRIDRGPSGGISVGRYYPNGRIVLDAGKSGVYLPGVAAHEFAHAHGYDGFHHDGLGLMTPSGGPILEWTKEDEESCNLACSR